MTTFNHPSVGGTPDDDSVTTAKLAADAVDGTKIADNALDSEHYNDGSIDGIHIANGTIGFTQVADSIITKYILYRVVENATDVAVDTTVGGDLEIPFKGTITAIGAYVDTAGTTGTMVVDVHLNGTTIMATDKLDIDTTEKSTRTGATAPVLTTTAVIAGDVITVDIDTIQTTAAKGLTIRIEIKLTT